MFLCIKIPQLDHNDVSDNKKNLSSNYIELHRKRIIKYEKISKTTK